jgi:hypothetical protein
VVCSLVNAIAIALYDFLAGSDPQRWPSAVVIGFGVFAVLVSAVVGRSLFQLRRMIARRDRRSFTSGAMSMYLLLTPIVWVMVVAIANSAT